MPGSRQLAIAHSRFPICVQEFGLYLNHIQKQCCRSLLFKCTARMGIALIVVKRACVYDLFQIKHGVHLEIKLERLLSF